MDKFGIFNLLNSFFSSGKTENGQNGNNQPSSNDLLGSLISSFSNNKSVEKQDKKTNLSPPLPLQNGMLATITSHDAIVKRVKEKQGSP